MDVIVQDAPDVAASDTPPALSAAAESRELEEIFMKTLADRGLSVGYLFESTYPVDANEAPAFGSVPRFRAQIVEPLLQDFLDRLDVPRPEQAAKLDYEERKALSIRLWNLRRQAGVTAKEMIRVRTIDNRTVALGHLREYSLKYYAYRYENHRSCGHNTCMFAQVVKTFYAAFAVAFRRYEAEYGPLPEELPA